MAWEAGSTPPTVTLKASGISLSLHIDELGLRGDQVPSTLRNIRALDLDLEAELVVPLAFAAPEPKKGGGAAAPAAAVGRGSAAGHPSAWGAASAGAGLPPPASPSAIDRLMGFEWRVLDAFRFEVTRLQVHSKGTGVVGVPAGLLKYVINAFVPEHVKAALRDAVPPELGVMLALHADHGVSLRGQVEVRSLPLDTVTAPLDKGVDITPPGGPAAHHGGDVAASLNVRAVLKQLGISQAAAARHAELAAARLQNAAAAGTRAPTASGAATRGVEITPGLHSTMAAAALGLTPSQARALVAAQLAVPVLKGAAPWRTLHDIMRFVAQYNPRSRFRTAQRAVHSLAVSGVVNRPSVDTVRPADERHWTQLLDLFQRLIDEHIQGPLTAVYEQVRVAEYVWASRPLGAMSSCSPRTPRWQALHAVDQVEAKRTVLAAQARAANQHVDVRRLCAAAEEVYAKPTQLHLSLAEFSLHVHAESLVGVLKSISLHALRKKELETTQTANAAVGASTAAEMLRRPAPVAAAAPPAVSSARATSQASGAAVASPSSSSTSNSLGSQAEGVRVWARDTGTQASDACGSWPLRPSPSPSQSVMHADTRIALLRC